VLPARFEKDRKARVAVEQDAGPSHWRMIWVEREFGRLGEDLLDCNS
jgi:hypothetical protein